MYLLLGGSTAGGVVIGMLFSPFRDRIARQTYCVVRKYSRPECYETLYEARIPRRAAQWMRENQDGTLSIELRTDVDAFNVAALRKRAWWSDFAQMMDALLRMQQATMLPVNAEPEGPWEDPLEPRIERIEQQQTEVLSLLRQMTGEIPVVLEWKDPEQRTLKSSVESVQAATHAGLLDDAEGQRLMDNLRNRVARREFGDEPSVMPQLAPTEAILAEDVQKALLQQEEEEKARRERFRREREGNWTDDPTPDNPHGIAKPVNPTTRTVVIPLKGAIAPKRTGDSVGGDR